MRGWNLDEYSWHEGEELWDEHIQDEVLEDIVLHENIIKFKVNGKVFKIFDDGQGCCEHRYITTDDDLVSFTGAKMLGVRLGEYRDVSDTHDPDDYVENHDASFLRIYTSKGVIVFETHVEHNGYYGGFSVVLLEG
jgi:hypothetical protein